MGGQPSAGSAVPSESTLVKGVSATVGSTLAPVPPKASATAQASVPSFPTTTAQVPTSSQAVLAEDAAKTKGKDSTKELPQAALEALKTPQVAPVTTATATNKTGPSLPMPTAPQEPIAVAITKTGVPAATTGPEFEPAQVDSGAAKTLHTDSSALAAISALLKTPMPVPGFTGTTPPGTSKTGGGFPTATLSQEPAGGTPARASDLAPTVSLGFEPSHVEPESSKTLPVPLTPQALPPDAAPAPATALQHADSSAMAAISALPRTSIPALGSTPAAPPPNTPALPTPLVAQVEGGLRWMLKGGSQEAQLQLHPDSLGQVTIHLRVEGGEVHARLWVTEAASVQAVQEGRPHLEASLKEQGLQLGSFDLQQGHRPFQEAPSTPAYPGRPVMDLVIAGQEAPAQPVATILNSRHVELYA
jgi:flagellar hook-length control protein FliK